MSKDIGAANNLTSLFGGGGFTPSFGLYGFTFVGFDTSSFALSVAIQLVQMWLQCKPAEQTLSLKRGQNLCVQTGTRCTKKVLGVCLEREQDHCCFNSILAKLINRQGRSQLGMAMDQCGGFSADQLAQLDFSKIDFSEFNRLGHTEEPGPGRCHGDVQKTVNDKVKTCASRSMRSYGQHSTR